MDPSLLMFRVYLRPYMIFTVPYPAYSCTSSFAQHAETVGPLSTSSSPGLQQGPHVGEAGKALIGIAFGVVTFIELDLVSTPCSLIGCRWSHALADSGRVADRAGRVVDEGEEVSSEPSQQCLEYTVLIAPFWLNIVSH